MFCSDGAHFHCFTELALSLSLSHLKNLYLFNNAYLVRIYSGSLDDQSQPVSAFTREPYRILAVLPYIQNNL